MAKQSPTARAMLKKPYARVLIPNEDGRYSAEILEFPGCFACGDTPEEAITNLENAAESWIEVAREQKQDIPEPLASYGYSGKINLRLPRSIHKAASRFAQREDVSLNQFFASAIAYRVGAEDLCEHLTKKLESRWSSVGSIAMLQQNNIISCFMFPTEPSSGFVDLVYGVRESPWKVITSIANPVSSLLPTTPVVAERTRIAGHA